MKYAVTCPHCSKELFISEEHFDNVCVCPRCNKEMIFTMDDIKTESQRKSSFKFVVAKFDEVEELINTLYKQEGWYVVSQSTVFLSETPGIFTSTSTREEGLALILRKDD